MNIREIKGLAAEFTADELEDCIQQEVKEGANFCLNEGSTARIINALAGAETLRQLMNDGMSEREALRELARRIRQVQGNSTHGADSG